MTDIGCTLANGSGMRRLLTTKLKESRKIYRHQGLLGLLTNFSRFVRRVMMEPWHLTGEQVYRLSSGQVEVQSAERKTIQYEGSFRERLPRQLAEAEGIIETPTRFIAEFDGACLLGSSMILEKERKYVLPVEVGSARRSSPQLVKNVSIADFVRSRTNLVPTERRLEEGFLLTDQRGLPFAHWFYETLPKLRWYERYVRITGHSPPLLVPAGLTDWQRTSLRLMGYPRRSWIEIDSRVTEVDYLAVPPHPYRNRGYDFVGSPSNLRWIRTRVLANLSGKDRDFSDRIYVSREDADRRRVQNEAELMDVLAELGFEKYVLSELPFQDQVRLFEGAELVVGPHGAGLTNLIYSDNAHLIELLTPKGASEHFFVLSNERNHSYEFALCAAVTDVRTPPRHQDMIADVDLIREVIKTHEEKQDHDESPDQSSWTREFASPESYSGTTFDPSDANHSVN